MDSKNKVTTYTDVVPDPPITHVVKGIEFMEAIKPTVIIAIGGGSCIDVYKRQEDIQSSSMARLWEDLALAVVPWHRIWTLHLTHYNLCRFMR